MWQQMAIADASELTSVGLVPTMGALHPGHLSLIQRARRENGRVLVTIFVNPLQFGTTEDIDAYPRTLEHDLNQCETAGVDAVFYPLPQVVYGHNMRDLAGLTQVVPPASMTAHLCGPCRPGHFAGVVLVVSKLFNLIGPTRAYFGRKDAQQLAIIKRMVVDLNFPIDVIDCPIVRQPDGLAYSSRNQYLTDDEQQKATLLFQGLQTAEQAFNQGERHGRALVDRVRHTLEQEPAIQIQYVELVHPDTLQPIDQVEAVGLLAIAAYLGKTRLIDNIILRSRQPIIAIDGPAGAGKSTVAKIVANQLGLLYLDSGAMYRAVTWQVLHLGIDPHDEVAVAEMLSECHIRLASESATDGQPGVTRVWVNNHDVTQAIRNSRVTAQVSTIAAQVMVRQRLLEQQQEYGANGGVVMEGRDIGTHVFPFAELKIFLTASVQERARRRQQDLTEQNLPFMNLNELEETIRERDYKDSTRRVAPLRKASDAIEVLTDGLSITHVVSKIADLYTARLAED